MLPNDSVRWYLGTDDNPNNREQVVISAKDAAKRPMNGDTSTFVVTDLLTRKRIKLRRADCGLGCQCAIERVAWREE
jgi:hypothetical protein